MISLASYFIGGFVGFNKGAFYGMCASAPSDTASILATISRIKNNRDQSAIDLLESKLDSKIMEHWILIKEGSSFFNLHSYSGMELGFNMSSFSLMKKAAQYRLENPYKEKDPGVADMIDEAIKFYLSNEEK